MFQKNSCLALLVVLLLVNTASSWQTETLLDICPAIGPPPFKLNDPAILTLSTGANLDYAISTPDPLWFGWDIFDSSCTNPIDVQPPVLAKTKDLYLNATAPILAEFSVGEGLNIDTTAELKIRVNPYRIVENAGQLAWSETSRSGAAPEIDAQGSISLCVKVTLYTDVPDGSNPDIVEVINQETQLGLTVRLKVDDEKYLSTTRRRGLRSNHDENETEENEGKQLVVVPPSDRQLSKCTLEWGVEVFHCPDVVLESDETQEQPSDLNTRIQIPGNDQPLLSDDIRICVQPNEEADRAGAAKRFVERLEVLDREFLGTQAAVVGGQATADGLSSIECGSRVCVVDIALAQSFFQEGLTQLPISIEGVFSFKPSFETGWVRIELDFDLPLEVEKSGASHCLNLLWAVVPGFLAMGFASLL